MMYKLRDGVVYEKVCGVHLLISTRKMWNVLPEVKKISPLQGGFCYGIQEGMSEEILLDRLVLPKKIETDVLRTAYHRFTEKMLEEGYLIKEE